MMLLNSSPNIIINQMILLGYFYQNKHKLPSDWNVPPNENFRVIQKAQIFFIRLKE